MVNIYEFLALSFIFGCFCGIKFQLIDNLSFVLFIGFLLLTKFLLFRTISKINLHYAFIIIIFTVGIITGNVHNQTIFSRVNDLYGTEITATGRVTESSGKTFVMEWEKGLLKVNHDGDEVPVDEIVSVTGYLKEYSVAKYNGDTDMKITNARKGIVGYVFCENPKSVGFDNSFYIWDTGRVIRNFMIERIKNFDAERPVKGLLMAMLTGNTSELNNEVEEAFRKTGVSHIISVSGFHISIFLGFFIVLTTRLKKKRFLYILTITSLIVFYILLVGVHIAVVRSAIMAIFAVLVPLIKRRSDSVVNLMTAGVIICIMNPYYAVDIGFQLSFLATFAIVLFTDRIKWQLITIPILVMTVIYPVNLYYFNTFPLEGVFVNVIVVGFSSIMLLAGYLGCFVPFVSHLAEGVCRFVIWITDVFSKMDFLHITMPSPTMHYFIAWTLIVAALYIALGKHSIRCTAFLLAMAVLVCVPAINMPFENHSSVSLINTGNFNAMHFTTQNGINIFVDCGFDTVEYMDKTGIDEVYILIVTERLWPDDYENVEELCSAGRIRNLFLPEGAKELNLKLENCEVLYYNKNDYSFEVDGISFAFDDINGKRYFRAGIYDEVITLPFNKHISDAEECTVMCVPDKCDDCDVANERCVAKYYVHPSMQYKDYTYGNKYVTSCDGTVKFIFYPNSRPKVLVSQQEVIF